MYNNLSRCKTNIVCNQGPQGSQGLAGPIGSRGFDGPTGSTGAQGKQGVGCRGVQGAQGNPGSPGGAQGSTGATGSTGPAVSIINLDVGSMVLRKDNGDPVYNNVLAVSIDASSNPQLDISGNLIPTISNTFTLGTIEKRYKDAFIGPGSLNIAGPNPSIVATIGSDDSGVAYSQFGFATPFLNVGPEIDVDKAVGGWQISVVTDPPLPDPSANPVDLVAQLTEFNGISYPGGTGPKYSLLSGKYGLTGPTGSQGSTGITGCTGVTGITGCTGV